MDESLFEWDVFKNLENQHKHGVSFEEAVYAFTDPQLILLRDGNHSLAEERFYCLGLDEEKSRVLTVRFTIRKGKVRIFGAGYWRRGKRIYEKENAIF